MEFLGSTEEQKTTIKNKLLLEKFKVYFKVIIIIVKVPFSEHGHVLILLLIIVVCSSGGQEETTGQNPLHVSSRPQGSRSSHGSHVTRC